MFRMDPRRSALHPGPGPQGTPTIAWSRDLDSPLSTLPILVGGLIIVGDQGSELVAFDARTGEERWRTTGDGSFSGTPAAADGTLVVADAAGILAVDAVTGAPRWRREILSEAPRLVIDEGIVYLGTTDGAVKGLDLATGEDRWSWQGDHSLSVRLDAVADGVAYANPNDGQVIAIELADGSERWRVRGKVARLSYTVAGDTFFMYNPGADSGNPVGEITAVDIASGQVRWRFAPPNGEQTVAGPAQDGILYVNTVSDGLYALADRGDTYDIAWHVDFEPVYFPMTLSGDVLYGVDGGGAPFALSAADGSLLWHGDGTGASALPLVSGGMLFDAESNGGPTVRAFADMDLIAKLPPPATDAQPSEPPVAGLPDPFHVVRATPLEETGVVLSPYDPPRSQGPEGVNMAAGPDGLLYVIDPASVVTVIDPASGEVVRRFGRQGAGEGEFDCVCDAIAVGPDGLLYVIDSGNHRVQVLESDGTFARQLGAFGSAEGQFVAPFALTIDDAGAAYVLDGDNGMISKFDADGAFIWRIGGPSGDPALRGGAYDVAAMKDGTILVTFDPGGPAVLLDPDDGSVIGPWGEERLGGSAEPTIDPAGNVFLFQYVPGAMRMFDAAGHPLGYLDYADDVPDPYRFYPSPVFTSDGHGYSFDDTQGLLELDIALP
jgi:outer membrane protein assembly factor BamB